MQMVYNKPDFSILVLGGCSPVGCVLIQLLRQWDASVTATCYQRAVPVAKALGAFNIIVLSDPPVTNNSFHKSDERSSYKNDLINQLELNAQTFDIVIITNREGIEGKDLTKFLKQSGSIYTTVPPPLLSDSCGFITKILLKWYTSTIILLKVSEVKYI